ncbi:hypothetical protein M408DRAFT_332623, partial [Serendipita vermifera MAFF 305830]
MADVSAYQRLHPRAYYEKFLSERIRPDGRGLDEFREVQITAGSISTADGSALVRLGETTVVCGVKAEIAEPELDAPTNGYIVPNVEISAICSPRFKPGPPSEEAQVLSQQLYQTILKSQMIPANSLVIHPGKAVWTIFVDAVCINYDGNALDATLLAMVSALCNTRLPKAVYDEERNTTFCSREETVSLGIQKVPVSMTFGVFDSYHVISDPNSFEEPLLDSTVTVVLLGDEAISVSQGGLGLAQKTASDNPVQLLANCVDVAKKRHKSVQAALQPVA